MSTRIVKVEAQVTTVEDSEGPWFYCQIFRDGKQVYEVVKAHKDGIADKALHAYSTRIKPCEFQVTLRPEVTRPRKQV